MKNAETSANKAVGTRTAGTTSVETSSGGSQTAGSPAASATTAGTTTTGTTTLELAYGKSKIPLAVPTKNLVGVLRTTEPTLPPSDEEEIERALREPIGSARLEDLAKPGMKVVIMASDITRPCPTKKLLPPLLSRLRSAGVRAEDITVMFGMGIHRNHTEAEKRTLVGDDVYESVRCLDSTEAGDFVLVGTTSRGTPVEVCRMVVECDLLICTGNVEYHYFVGYTGGVKAVLPGACSRRTVEANHSMQLMPGAEAGSYDENPVRQDIEEAGAMIGVDFILNVVLDENKRIVKAVAGHPTEAHAVARAVVDQVYGVRIPEKADIVVASAGGFPKDVNLYQAQKALDNAGRAVRDGGTVILVAECDEGLGEDVFERYLTGMGLDEVIESVRRQFVLGGHKAAAIARVIKRATVVLVSAMDPELVRRCKMVPAVGDVAAGKCEWKHEGAGQTGAAAEICKCEHNDLRQSDAEPVREAEAARGSDAEAEEMLDRAFAEAMGRYGEEAKVVVMPWAGGTVVVQ